jgi:hypothetical protein
MTAAQIESKITNALKNDKACGHTLNSLWAGMDRNDQAELAIVLAKMIGQGKVRKVNIVSHDINGEVYENTNYRINY